MGYITNVHEGTIPIGDVVVPFNVMQHSDKIIIEIGTDREVGHPNKFIVINVSFGSEGLIIVDAQVSPDDEPTATKFVKLGNILTGNSLLDWEHKCGCLVEEDDDETG